MKNKIPYIFLSAGEPSGDLLGAQLIPELIKKTKGKIKLGGIGGESMEEYKEFKSLFDTKDLAVMGLTEVIPKLPKILKIFNETLKNIIYTKPDVIVTIDSPGFNRKLAQKLKANNIKIPIIHYVAPQVWKWKPHVAEQISKEVDQLLCLLPFEPPYFEKFGLKSHFVGHPVIERVQSGNKTEFLKKYNLKSNNIIISVLPGSRHTETKKLLPIFKKVVQKLYKLIPDLKIVIPTVKTVEKEIYKKTKKWPVKPIIVKGQEERYNAFKASTAALAASGTVSLELAALQVPHIIAYKFSWLTYRIISKLLNDTTASLVNILSDQKQLIIPEFIQDTCRPDTISESMLSIINNKAIRKAMVTEMSKSINKLYPDKKNKDVKPSEEAADVILNTVKARKW